MRAGGARPRAHRRAAEAYARKGARAPEHIAEAVPVLPIWQ